MLINPAALVPGVNQLPAGSPACPSPKHTRTCPAQIVLIVPWCYFGAIFVAALAALGFTLVAYSCTRLRELAMPLGTLGLLASAGAQLPGWVLLARALDGDGAIAPAAYLAPMAGSWAGMWASALVVACGLAWKERLRAALAAAGRSWTADDATHRSVMRADVAETQRQVDAMSDAQLAKLTRTLMKASVCFCVSYARDQLLFAGRMRL